MSSLRTLTQSPRTAVRGFFTLTLLTAAASASAYVAPPGYQTTGQTFPASAIAVSPDGKVAVGTDNFSGGASVSVYSSLSAVGSTPLQTFTAPTWQYIAGLDFADPNTLVIGENGATDTAYSANVSTGSIQNLLPVGSLPSLSDVYIHAGTAYFPTAGGPAHNNLFSVPLTGASSPTLLISNFGAGYGGGVVINSAGQYLLTDSAGSVLRYDSSLSPLPSISLTPGNGSGAVDIALDSAGNAYVTTGNTLTEIQFSSPTPAVSQFGSFDPSSFPFPTYLAYTGSDFSPYTGNAQLLVSGFDEETPAGGVFIITPALPEPATLTLLSLSTLLITRRSSRGVHQ
ncbi:MAG TPA: hypothetical protein VFE58_16635 [Tepidisphaeraceae bacterium]|jgi:hypothetical protein|nr:hypothetical protein [Tepidisphaeraceae bacterium]